MDKIYICKYCGKEFINSHSYASHMSNCKLNPNLKRTFNSKKISERLLKFNMEKRKNNPYKFENKNFNIICKQCGKEFTINCTQYEFDNGKYKKYCCRSCANTRTHSKETIEKIRNSIKAKNNTNNKIKELCSVPRICECCGKEFIPKIFIRKNGKKTISKAKTCSKDCRNKILSLKNKLAGSGGFRENSVKSYKYGTYNGIHCDSSWELAFVIWNIEHNNKIERCNEVRTYIEDGIEKLYYPDFVVNDSIIYEVKGLKNNNAILKQQFNNDIIFLYRADMKPYIDYVVNKYGKDFIKLYNN